MHGRREEIIIVSIASIMLIGVFGAIAIFDRPHQEIGAEYGLDQVNVSISGTEGNIVSPDTPEGLIVFGAGQLCIMDITVSNSDPDNDIDTIVVTVPGAIITNSSYLWAEDGETHEWNATVTGDSITFTAMTDYAGINHGGSAQYDTSGGEDDALDHDRIANISEGIALSIHITAPAIAGLKAGGDAINVEVGDLKTENVNPLETFAPFPYPYWVAQNGAEYIVMVLDTTTVDLEVVYGTETYFGASRGATDFQVEEHGIKYRTSDGKAVAVIEKPTDSTVVKPIIRPLTAGLTGQFDIDVFKLKVTDINQSPTSTPIVTNYMEDIPSAITSTVDLDIDSDGIYNNADPDMDGDGQENALDRAPRDRNVQELPPTGLQATSDRSTVKTGETFTLAAQATDGNSDPITYTWTVDKIALWSKTGSSVTLKAEGDFQPGTTYVFKVTATDNRHPDKPTDDITITIEKEKRSDMVLIIVIVAILAAVAIVALFFIFRKKEGTEGEIEEKVESLGSPAETRPEPKDMPQDAETAAKKTKEYEVDEMEEEDEEKPAEAEAGSEEIEDLESLAMDLDSTDACPECNALLGPNDLKCSSCGTEFDLEIICPECNSPLDSADKKCPGCGMEFA